MIRISFWSTLEEINIFNSIRENLKRICLTDRENMYGLTVKLMRVVGVKVKCRELGSFIGITKDIITMVNI